MMLNINQAVGDIRWVSEQAGSFRRRFKDMGTGMSREGKIFEYAQEFAVTFDEEQWHINVSSFGTNIRFQLFLALDGGEPAANVVCLHKYRLGDETIWSPLGTFTFKENGNTSFGADERGHYVNVTSHADVITAYFLQQAYLAAARICAQ